MMHNNTYYAERGNECTIVTKGCRNDNIETEGEFVSQDEKTLTLKIRENGKSGFLKVEKSKILDFYKNKQH